MKPNPEKSFSKFKKLAIALLRADAKKISGNLTNDCWKRIDQFLASK
jgi:hypothetical protein